MKLAHIEAITQTLSNYTTSSPQEKTIPMSPYGGQYCTLSLKPYQYGTYNTGMWHNILKNLSDIPVLNVGIIGNASSIRLVMRINAEDKKLVETILYTIYPDIGIEEHTTLDQDFEYFYFTPSAGAQRGDGEYFQKQGFSDPFVGLISLFHSVPDNQEWFFSLDAKKGKSHKFWSFFSPLFQGGHGHDEYSVVIKFGSKQMYKGIDDAMIQICRTLLQNFLVHGSMTISMSPKHTRITRETFATLFHIPAEIPGGMIVNTTKQFPIPTALKTQSETDLLTIGDMPFRGTHTPLRLQHEDLCRHLYVVGKTGMGKTTFARSMISDWIKTGMGCCVFDPHGDLTDDILMSIPKHRINDVVVIDINDHDYPIGYNMLGYDSPEEKDLLVSGLMAVLYKLFSYSRGPRLEYILRNAILTAMEIPQATIYDIVKILTNTEVRNRVVATITDPIVKDFWLKEFNQWPERQRQEAVGPVTNKLGQFLSHPRIRAIFGQVRKTVSFRTIITQGKICLINLAKGKIGEDIAAIIGSFFVTQLQIDVMTMPTRPEKKFLLFIDEFQHFATDSFATFLSEARKFGVGLVLLHQYIDQMSESTKAAVFGNVGSIISFGVGAADGAFLATEFNQTITAKDFVSLPQFTCYAKIMHKSQRFFPLSLHVPYTPVTDNQELKQSIISQSRARYSITQATAEHIIQRVDEVKERVLSEQLAPQFLDEITIGQTYVGKVKFLFNYGIFVTRGKREGLLLKRDIMDGETGMRKKTYAENDPITVIAKGFKTLDMEKKVIWSQNM